MENRTPDRDLPCLSLAEAGDLRVQPEIPLPDRTIHRVETWVSESRSHTVQFSYEIRLAGDDRLLATGETLHTVCDREGKTARGCRRNIGRSSLLRVSPKPPCLAAGRGEVRGRDVSTRRALRAILSQSVGFSHATRSQVFSSLLNPVRFTQIVVAT